MFVGVSQHKGYTLVVLHMLFQIEKSGGGNAAATFVISCFGKKYDAKLLLFCCFAQAIDLFFKLYGKTASVWPFAGNLRR